MKLFRRAAASRGVAGSERYPDYFAPSLFAAFREAGWDLNQGDSIDYALAVMAQKIHALEEKSHE